VSEIIVREILDFSEEIFVPYKSDLFEPSVPEKYKEYRVFLQEGVAEKD